jgi:AcrR family transcriptional regulator
MRVGRPDGVARDQVQAVPRLAPPTPEAAAIRENILDACRRLFNEEGLPNVTTARIAAALDMNEGRLHYYFNTKAQIVTALFDRLEIFLREAAAHGLDAPGREDRYADYQQNWFVFMWRFRFFYRDQRTLYRIAPGLRRRLAELYDTGRKQLREVLDDMAGLGLIKGEPDDLEAVSTNAWIIFFHWIDYITTLRGTDQILPADLESGIYQIDSLFFPYLTAYGRAKHARRRRLADLPTDTLEYTVTKKPESAGSA